MQIGTNNCTARYRTLSGGGIGESPSLSPSPSSDYDDDEAASGKQQQQQHLPTLNCSSKNKWNGNHKGAIISQKATVHHVSTLTQKSFASAQNTTTFSIRGFFLDVFCLFVCSVVVVAEICGERFQWEEASNKIAQFDMLVLSMVVRAARFPRRTNHTRNNRKEKI